MCGIAGLIKTQNKTVDRQQIQIMLKALSHRGPNDCGIMLYDSKSNQFDIENQPHNSQFKSKPDMNGSDFRPDVAIGNRRLSIVDASDKGHQPFANENKTVWVVFNGEIYNYRPLQEELTNQGHVFISQCDTEVIVHGYEEWGLEELLQRIKGMWAIGIWDANKNCFFLVRDPYGVKPLFYRYYEGDLYFGSEKKAILNIFPDLNLNQERIADFLWFEELLPPKTIWESICELLPAFYLELNLEKSIMHSKKYYEIGQRKKDWGNLTKEKSKIQEAYHEIRNVLTDSVKKHTESEQSIAYLLSGGIDSTILASLAANPNNIQKPIDCFTGIPEDPKFSEEKYVLSLKKECQQLNLHFIRPKFEDFIKDLPKFISAFDSPLLSIGAYMEYKVLAHIKSMGFRIAIYGQGADELLGGYRSYLINFFKDLIKTKKMITFIKEIFLFRNVIWEYLGKYLRRKIGMKEKNFRTIIKTHKPKSPYNLTDMPLNQRLIHDLMQGGYLNDIVKTNDVVSMRYGIENRVPFLYQPFVEEVVGLPNAMKIKNGWTKYVLREAFRDIIPEKIRKRRDKLGFPGPDELWAKRMIQEYSPLLNELITGIGEYVDINGFKGLCGSITKKAKAEDLQLFWRLVLFGFWYKYVYQMKAYEVKALDSNQVEFIKFPKTLIQS